MPDGCLGDGGYPKGCYVYNGDGKAYFNPHRFGDVDPQRQPLCVRSLNAPGAAPSGGALPRRCTCTCSVALASRCHGVHACGTETRSQGLCALRGRYAHPSGHVHARADR